MKIFFITGENSGDVLAASLIKKLKAGNTDIECLGVGGPRMKSAGFNELLPMDQISVMGIWEVLPKIPRLIKINKAIVEEIEKQQPDMVVTVDFPDFNFRIAKSLKKRGIYKGKIVHYVAPSVWAWRPGRAKAISGFLDAIICLFPMETKYFEPYGLPAKYVGHPVVETNALDGDGNIFKKENDIGPDDNTLGIFFGSREGEFKSMGPILCQTAKFMEDVTENLKIIAPTLPDLEYEIQTILKGFSLPVFVSANPNIKWDAFKACDVAVAVSGTVALELAYAGIPHIIVYKANPITALIVKLMAKVKHVHLANILLGEAVVPELLQGKCKPEIIAEAALKLSSDKEAQEKQKEKFKELRSILGAGETMSPSQKAANFIMELAQGTIEQERNEPPHQKNIPRQPEEVESQNTEIVEEASPNNENIEIKESSTG